jgi:hypothetical protein
MTDEEKKAAVQKEFAFINERIKALGDKPTPADLLMTAISIGASGANMEIILSQPDHSHPSIHTREYQYQLAETKERKAMERIEFHKELAGVFLRLGYINSGNGQDLCTVAPDLDQQISWELGIQPDSELAALLASFKEYLDNKRNEQLH